MMTQTFWNSCTWHLLLQDTMFASVQQGEICKQLKSHEQTRDIPIIMLSAHASERKIPEVCPADDFLAKPFHLETLLNKVEQQLPVHS
jgi:CheY-like chemotaxis protein